jgi:hypothetical protein
VARKPPRRSTPAQRAASRRNGVAGGQHGHKGGRPPDPPPPDPAPSASAAPLDELDIIRRQLARLNAEADLLYAPGSRIGRRERAKEHRAIVPKARLRRAELEVRGELEQIASPVGDPELEDLGEQPDGDE